MWLQIPRARSFVPVLAIGQSNIAGGYRPATDWPVALQGTQNIPFAYKLFCHHQPDPPTGIDAQNDSLHALQPFQVGVPASGSLMGSWMLDLGRELLAISVKPAILNYAIGGQNLDYFRPGGVNSAFTSILSWMAQRLRELGRHSRPVIVMYQGESGIGTAASWADGFTDMMEGMRDGLSVHDMGAVVVKIPASYEDGPLEASQVAYVAGDSRSRLAFDDAATFITNPGPPNLHIDQVSGARLARVVAAAVKELV